MNTKATNIIFSSWPGAGGSTAARFIALLLGMKYVYAGGTLKRWADKMGYDSKSNEINAWAEKYHDYWDHVWEGFIAQYSKTAQKTVFEGMTAGFMLNGDNLFKIFIKANLEARDERAGGDGRTESVANRDKFLQKEWIQRFGIDLFDEDLISEKYDFVLDASALGIQDVASTLLKEITSQKEFSEYTLEELQNTLNQMYKNYEKDSGFLMNELEKKNLIVSSDKLLEMIHNEYPELVENIPEEMKKVMSN